MASSGPAPDRGQRAPRADRLRGPRAEPGRAGPVLPPGLWAGDNPKRPGAGSFLQEFPAPHTSRGCPLPLTKYGAARRPAGVLGVGCVPCWPRGPQGAKGPSAWGTAPRGGTAPVRQGPSCSRPRIWGEGVGKTLVAGFELGRRPFFQQHPPPANASLLIVPFCGRQD